MEHGNDSLESIREDIRKINNKLIAQEHRRYSSFKNLFQALAEHNGSQASWDTTTAAATAVISSWLFNRTAGLVVISLSGIFGAVIAILTLCEFKNQNDIVAEQNDLFREQTLQQVITTNSQMVSDLIGDLYEERKSLQLSRDSLWHIPATLANRVAVVAQALEPYDTVAYTISRSVVSHSDTYQIEKGFYSRERGQLLSALINLRVAFPLTPNPNFTKSLLINQKIVGANLNRANLAGSSFSGSDLLWCNFELAKLIDVSFSNSLLYSSNFYLADLSRSVFNNASLGEMPDDLGEGKPLSSVNPSTLQDMYTMRRNARIYGNTSHDKDIDSTALLFFTNNAIWDKAILKDIDFTVVQNASDDCLARAASLTGSIVSSRYLPKTDARRQIVYQKEVAEQARRKKRLNQRTIYQR